MEPFRIARERHRGRSARYGLVAVLFLAAALLSMMEAGADGPNRSFLGRRPPPPPLVNWVLLGNPQSQTPDAHAGVVLFAHAGSPLQISLDLNPATQASGSIFEAPTPDGFPDCGHKWHYHGSLFGTTDNGQGCGQGVARPDTMVTVPIRTLSAATMDELEGRGFLLAVPPDYKNAQKQLKESAARLKLVRNQVGGGVLDPETQAELIAILDKLDTFDKALRGIVTLLARNTDPLVHDVLVVAYLQIHDAAIKCKGELAGKFADLFDLR